MKISSLLHFTHAAHHTWLVDSPWKERGGLLYVAPPGNLKTTVIFSLENYSEAKCLTDINMRTMKPIRDQVLSGRYRTLAFGELEKLYARNLSTASNIEAHLKLFVEEGLRRFSHEDPDAEMMPARALVFAGITPGMFGQQITAWRENGFLRRFLRLQWVLEDENVLLDAVHAWKKVEFDLPTTWNGRLSIPYNLEEKESKWLISLIDGQREITPAQLLKKIACVLKKRKPDEWRKIMTDVAPAMSSNGALLSL